MQKTQQKKAQNIINANIAVVQTVPKKFKGNRRNNHPVVPHVYGHPVVPHVYAGQFVAPWDYAVCILGQRFLVCGNGRPDRILLFSADEGFGFLSNSRDWFLYGAFESGLQSGWALGYHSMGFGHFPNIS